jgi:hypothetical protein
MCKYIHNTLYQFLLFELAHMHYRWVQIWRSASLRAYSETASALFLVYSRVLVAAQYYVYWLDPICWVTWPLNYSLDNYTLVSGEAIVFSPSSSNYLLYVLRVIVSPDHTHTHGHKHTRLDSPGQRIGPSQRSFPDSTQHSQEINILAPGNIRTRNTRKRAVTGLCLIPRGRVAKFSVQNCRWICRRNKLHVAVCRYVRTEAKRRLTLGNYAWMRAAVVGRWVKFFSGKMISGGGNFWVAFLDTTLF